MDILEVLEDKSTNLPIVQINTEDFTTLIRRLFQEFLDVVNNTDDFFLINGQSVSTLEYKDQIKKLCNGLLETIFLYYQGHPAKAFNRLDEALHESKVRNFLDKDLFINEGVNFYRIRNCSGNYPLSKEDLFHIPFDQRGKVSTQRFSIPGLPSLYISNSIYVAWEEMRRPSFDSLQAIRLVTKKQINLLDLTSEAYNNCSYALNLNKWDALYKVLTWPLVACCSIKVKTLNDSFKPEYIIPQLLLQWINKEKLHGIKYSSTHIDTCSVKVVGSFYNIVLPVRSFVEKGFCTELASMFTMSQVLPMQLRQFASNSDKFNNMISISTNVNSDITSIELIKGTSQSYSNTSFGILEHSLNSLDLSPLN